MKKFSDVVKNVILEAVSVCEQEYNRRNNRRNISMFQNPDTRVSDGKIEILKNFSNFVGDLRAQEDLNLVEFYKRLVRQYYDVCNEARKLYEKSDEAKDAVESDEPDFVADGVEALLKSDKDSAVVVTLATQALAACTTAIVGVIKKQAPHSKFSSNFINCTNSLKVVFDLLEKEIKKLPNSVEAEVDEVYEDVLLKIAEHIIRYERIVSSDYKAEFDAIIGKLDLSSFQKHQDSPHAFIGGKITALEQVERDLPSDKLRSFKAKAANLVSPAGTSESHVRKHFINAIRQCLLKCKRSLRTPAVRRDAEEAELAESDGRHKRARR